MSQYVDGAIKTRDKWLLTTPKLKNVKNSVFNWHLTITIKKVSLHII